MKSILRSIFAAIVIAAAVSAAPAQSPRNPTLPPADQPAPIRFVYTGDTNFAHAPFGVAAGIPGEHADVFIWFGDTIYADVSAGGLGHARTFDDYMAKYQQVLSDPSIAAALASTPVWVQWDDHEVFNDYSGLDPSLSLDQQLAAYEAFFQSLPIERQNIPGDEYRTYRRYQWGSEIEFYLLDGRQYRDPESLDACGPNLDPYGVVLGPLGYSPSCLADLSDQSRTMLGRTQLDWLESALQNSTAKVKVICNNVPFSFIGPYPYDRWDGYDGERREILEFIDQNSISGVFLLTTDIHANAFNPDVGAYFRAYRPDYSLPGNVAIAEAIVGPLGNETFHQSITQSIPFLTAIVTPLETATLAKIRHINGMPMFEPNRVSYLVADITADGVVSLVWKGSPPEKAHNATVAPEEFFSVQLGDATNSVPGPTCGAPFIYFGFAGLGVAALRSTSRLRRRCQRAAR